MRKDQMYTVGQVSSICNIPVQTLHYYNKINLVQPGRTDPYTNYRYYTNYDILLVKVVQDMKRFRFTLEQIGQALQSEGLEKIIEMMKGRHESIQREIESLREVSSSLEQRMEQVHYLQKINGLVADDGDVLLELKRLPPRNVARERVRGVCGMEPSVLFFNRLFEDVGRAKLTVEGYILTVYHENLLTFDRNDCDLEYGIPVSKPSESPFTRTIEGGEYLTALYAGIPNEDSCKRVYRMMLDWMNANRYEEAGPAIEQYLVDMTRMMKPEDFIIELQIPVKPLLTL